MMNELNGVDINFEQALQNGAYSPTNTSKCGVCLPASLWFFLLREVLSMIQTEPQPAEKVWALASLAPPQLPFNTHFSFSPLCCAGQQL